MHHHSLINFTLEFVFHQEIVAQCMKQLWCCVTRAIWCARRLRTATLLQSLKKMVEFYVQDAMNIQTSLWHLQKRPCTPTAAAVVQCNTTRDSRLIDQSITNNVSITNNITGGMRCPGAVIQSSTRQHMG